MDYFDLFRFIIIIIICIYLIHLHKRKIVVCSLLKVIEFDVVELINRFDFVNQSGKCSC